MIQFDKFLNYIVLLSLSLLFPGDTFTTNEFKLFRLRCKSRSLNTKTIYNGIQSGFGGNLLEGRREGYSEISGDTFAKQLLHNQQKITTNCRMGDFFPPSWTNWAVLLK